MHTAQTRIILIYSTGDEDSLTQDDKKMRTREVWKLDTVTQILTDTYPIVRHVINGGMQSMLECSITLKFLLASS